MHAHFDCFSGAAGDMMLAACLDAADSLPDPLQLGLSPPVVDGADDCTAKNSDVLLSQLVHDLEGGLPELKGEFELSVKRVWRGMGRIAAKKVDVQSVYNHEAAPVPGAQVNEVEEKVHSHEHAHRHEHDHEHSSYSCADVDEGKKEDPQKHGDAHNHSHGHSHDSGHSHNHSDSGNNSHDHGHAHENSHNHGHNHGHGHDHQSQGGKLRNLPQIKQMLQSAPSHHIPRHVATLAIQAFTALAHAEMHTHGAESIDQVHFHEVGAVDSIVDTVGTLLALYHLGVNLGDGGGKNVAVTCSPLPLGEGTVWTDHGLLPVPAPATMRLMIGMPTCPGPKGVTGELVTPTAAALLRVLTGVDTARGSDGTNDGSYWQAKGVLGRPPSMIPRAVGVGAGSKDFERHPNVIRLILGDDLNNHTGNSDTAQTEEKTDDAGEESNNDSKKVSESMSKDIDSGEVSKNNVNDREDNRESNNTKQKPQLWDMHELTHMQANIDDATPELLAHAINLLLKNGAIDAWVHPIVMKKGRPANSLHCICRCEVSKTGAEYNESAEHRLLNIMFRHTTTLGIRIQRNILRAALQRRFVEVQLPYKDNIRDGKVDVKISSLNDGEVMSVKAEFDHCKVVSEESGIPLKIVSSAAERLAWDNHITP